MNRIGKNLVAMAIVALVCTGVGAVPAYPGKVQVVQPDGTLIVIRQHGDEHLHWAETPDGYTLLRDGEGYWAFARQAPSGMLEASDLRYRNDSRAAFGHGIRPGLRFSSHQVNSARKAKASDLQIDESFPANGKHRLLMLLVCFSDTEPTYTQANFDAMMNQEGYGGIGSFRDYYAEASYGRLDVETTVTRWVKLPHPKSYYGSDGAVAVIKDALTLLDNEIDLADFDNDGDGVLDGLAVIHQGPGQEYTASPGDIWSHSSTIYGMSFDGIQVRRYTIEPEVLGLTGRMSTIGVVCHEFGHNLGAPDFYDTDYSGSGGDYCGTGVWDLLGSGAWNGNDGDRPAGINMWQKIQFGWCDPIVLSETTTVSGMKQADKYPVAYKMETTVPGEYFIMENRQQDGVFDQSLPGHGMIIYHVNEQLIRQSVQENTLNASYPQAIYTVCASSGQEPSEATSSFGDVNTDAAPFPGTKGIREFSDRTLPSTKSYTGRYTYKALSGITETNGEIGFKFTCEEAPASPEHFTATAERGVIRLSWQLPVGAKASDITCFTIYRDGQQVATTTALEYVDGEITSQTSVDYYVDAVYASGLVSPYVQTSVRIPANYITGLSGTQLDEGAGAVRLTWDLNTVLTRMTSQSEIEVVEYNTASLDYVHRFTTDDLRVYKGYKIRRVGFMPSQGPQELSFTLRVWEADADGGNARIVSERAIKEFGNSVWNDLLLTSSVEIADQQQLWIGLHCETSSGCIKIVNDRSADGNGMGNWIRTGDGEWMEDTDCQGNYFLRFTLLAPSEDPVPEELPEVGDVSNPATELQYPVGFSVYRDGEYLGRTSSRCFVDESPLWGTHLYSVANLYKGNNESVVASVDVTVTGASGIDEMQDHRLSVIADADGLMLPAYAGLLTVYDSFGRMVVRLSGYRAGERVALPSGLYLVRTAVGTVKAVVR